MAKDLKNQWLFDRLSEFSESVATLEGIDTSDSAWTLVMQLEESHRRRRYLELLQEIRLQPRVADPRSIAFDPIKAAILHKGEKNFNEACWLIFLAVYFGRHRAKKWKLCADVYGGCGPEVWSWVSVNERFLEFAAFLRSYNLLVKQRGGSVGFGNHRKYESLKNIESGVYSYTNWVGKDGDHQLRFELLCKGISNPCEKFSVIESSLSGVQRFGRTACYDYLVLMSRLRFLEIEADGISLSGATGPLAGAKLLLTNDRTKSVSLSELDSVLRGLRDVLELPFDVIEDAICNWQKSPNRFVRFRG